MSRNARREKSEARLRELKAEYRAELIAGLKALAAGKWGFFEEQEIPDGDELYPLQVAARELLELGRRIEELRAELGYTDGFPLDARYHHYRGMRDGNDPGEPKRARLFLKELEAAGV